MILYENARRPESQSRDPAGTRHLPATLRATLPPLAQPGERGALPHGVADRPAAQELRYYRRRGGGDFDRTLATSLDRCDLGAPGPRPATRADPRGAESAPRSPGPG